MSVTKLVYSQFKRPTGLLGAVVGHLMAIKNGRRGRWVVDLLHVEAGMRVLEIGCGPGVDAARVLERLGPRGSYVGLDTSDVMVRQASSRNRAAARDGRARFVVGDLARGLDSEPSTFDLAFSINCAQFWPDLGAGLKEIGRVVRSGGRIVVAVQPMRRGATEEDSTRWVEKFSAAADIADARVVEIARGATTPSTVAVVLEKP
jgi:ubiquinone/menaquinone biosynthesis C-methylase UbiE